MGMTTRSMLGKWFHKKRGLASGIANMSSSFFFSLAPVPLDWMINSFSWRGAWIVMGLVVGIGMTLMARFFFFETPEECGLLMDGAKAEKRDENIESASGNVRQITRGEAMRTPTFWIYNLGLGMFALLLTAITFHIVSIGSEAGLSRLEALRFFLPMAVVSIATSLVSGWLIDRTDLRWFMVIHLITLGLGSVGVINPGGVWGKSLMVICLGITGGTWSNLTLVIWPRFYGRKHLGAISSINMACMVAGSAVGPFIFGMSHDFTGSYSLGIKFCLIPLAVFLVLTFFTRDPQKV